MPQPRRERLASLSVALDRVQEPIRVLRTVAWGPEVAKAFFASGCRELPNPTYEVDPAIATAVGEIEALIASCDPHDPAEQLIAETAHSFGVAGKMLIAVGTPDFYRYSREAYGGPSDTTFDSKLTNLDLARHLVQFVEAQRGSDLGGPPAAVVPAHVVARDLRRRFETFFGADAPEVRVVPGLASRAVAGARLVRVRARTGFTEAEITRLEHHEGYVHVATTLNGHAQPVLPSLELASPRVTVEQEGLAVFAELQAMALDLERVRNLADRVIGISMAEAGASFVDVFNYFREHAGTEEEAFEATRRVFRGGVLAGGAPFTKDGVYIAGLMMMYCLVRRALARGRSDFVRWIFAGKLAIEDLPRIVALSAEGLVIPPRYLPPWASDQRFLAASMAFGTFLDRADHGDIARFADHVLDDTPVVQRAPEPR